MKLHDIDYFKYGKIENKKFWKRLGSKPDFKNKKVLDFGCGHGSLTLDIVALGAQKVIGIDLEINLIKLTNCLLGIICKISSRVSSRKYAIKSG